MLPQALTVFEEFIKGILNGAQPEKPPAVAGLKLAIGTGRTHMVLVMVSGGHGDTALGALISVIVYIPETLNFRQIESVPGMKKLGLPNKLPDARVYPVDGKIVQYLVV